MGLWGGVDGAGRGHSLGKGRAGRAQGASGSSTWVDDRQGMKQLGWCGSMKASSIRPGHLNLPRVYRGHQAREQDPEVPVNRQGGCG